MKQKRLLLILRHAKSDRDGAASSDFDRPLARRGTRDAPRVGVEIGARGWLPDHILCSPAVRARDTARAVMTALDLPERGIHFDARLYLAAPDSLLKVLSACPPQARRVLLVGHNPGLEELLEYLADAPPPRNADGKLLTTAALACLETEQPWRGLDRGGARLVELVRPGGRGRGRPASDTDGRVIIS